MKDLYNEDYKTFIKQINENTNTWKEILYSRIERFGIVKIQHPSMFKTLNKMSTEEKYLNIITTTYENSGLLVL